MGDEPKSSIKFWQSLSFKLTAWAALCLIVLTTIAIFIVTRELERSSIEKTLQTGNWFSDTVKRATRYSMLKDQRDNVHAIINAIGRQEGVEAIRVLNKQGRIMFSSRPEETGKMVDLQAEACYGCHRFDQPLERLPTNERSRIFTTSDNGRALPHRVLGIINPIYTEKACYTDPCHAHPPEQKVLGVLDVALSLAKVDKEVAASAYRVSAFGVVMLLAMTTILISITFFFVNRPLSYLVRATRRIARGDYDHPVSREGGGEVGVLAHSFDQMRLAVKGHTEALDQSRRQFQTLFEQVPCYVSVQNRQFEVVAANSLFEKDFGDRVGEFCYKAYKGREAKCPNCAVEKTFNDGQVHSAEEVVTGQDGSLIYFLNLTAPIADKDGDTIFVMEMATNITPIRELEQELRKSEEKYRLFFNNDPNPIFVFGSEDLIILDANDRAAKDYQYAKEELTGMDFLGLVDPSDRGRVGDFLQGGGSLLPRVRLMTRAGEPVMVNLRAARGGYLGREAIIASCADISETLAAEQQLVQAAKMATLGEMSAGIAHELNQPLSVISTAGGILRKQMRHGREPNAEVLAQVAEEVQQQVQRATLIINHLRQFGRKAEVDRARIRLSEPIEGVFRLLGQQMRVHDIAIELDLDEQAPPVWGEENRLEQVFINMVLNARDAIEEKRLAQGPFAGKIQVELGREGRMVVVRVSDNGAGVPKQYADRIFEPFFTTKEVGKGTGLGLSISYGIVRDYGGTIEVNSQEGRGSTFRISFPVAQEEAA